MKKWTKFLFVLLVAVVVTSYSVSGTYAKYTSTFNSKTDTARVAKWNFKINGHDLTAEEEFAFDLFKTVNDTGNSADDEDVTNGSSENIIAPGTAGSFKIQLTNDSEVNANYKVDYQIVNNDKIPVEFSIDGDSWTTDLSNVPDTKINSGASTDIDIQWRWTFEASTREAGDYSSSTSDTSDTKLGKDNTAKITVKATVTATQID